MRIALITLDPQQAASSGTLRGGRTCQGSSAFGTILISAAHIARPSAQISPTMGPMTTNSRPKPPDELTRSTRLAANAGAVAALAYAVVYFVTTQIKIVRAASPFGDDPWDVVVSYGAIFLALVVGATGVRSLRHRESRLEPAIAARIRTGIAMALLTIGLTLASDVSALLFAPLAGT